MDAFYYGECERTNAMERLKQWVREHTPDGLGILIPVSGGLDSAFCFWLYNKVFPERTVGVFAGTELRAEEWFLNVGTVRKVAPLTDVVGDPELMRWAQFLKMALSENRILVGSRNRTEHVLGTFSHASRVAFHLPLVGRWKSEVLELCEAAGVPEEIIASSRAADPVCGRTETFASIPFEAVDAFLQEKIGETAAASVLTEQQRAYLEELYARHGYKRDLPLKN